MHELTVSVPGADYDQATMLSKEGGPALVMHTETNLANAEQAPTWLWKQWTNMVRLRADGVPIIGFTWYSLIDQVDWDTALREDNGHVNPLGLFNLHRQIRLVGEAYRRLIEQ